MLPQDSPTLNSLGAYPRRRRPAWMLRNGAQEIAEGAQPARRMAPAMYCLNRSSDGDSVILNPVRCNLDSLQDIWSYFPAP